MEIGYYPKWERGYVRNFFETLAADGQRRKAEARLRVDLLTLANHWPRPLNVQVRLLKGHEPLWELKREIQGIAYRIFFCTMSGRIWLLHAMEKKSPKTPISDLDLAYRRMQDVLMGRVAQSERELHP